MTNANKRTILAAALGLAIAVCAGQAHAGVLLSDNFDSENGGAPQLNYYGFQNFTVTQGSVDLIGNGSFDFYPGHGLYVDLNGSTYQSGTLASNAVFGPGSYTLSFEIGNNPSNQDPNSMTVSLGSYSQTYTRTGDVPLQLVTATFTTTTGGSLTFGTPLSDSDNIGVVIDNVRLATAPTPEPSTFALAGLGGLGLAGYAYRRSRRVNV
jgi:hypothetical protein